MLGVGKPRQDEFVGLPAFDGFVEHCNIVERLHTYLIPFASRSTSLSFGESVSVRTQTKRSPSHVEACNAEHCKEGNPFNQSKHPARIQVLSFEIGTPGRRAQNPQLKQEFCRKNQNLPPPHPCPWRNFLASHASEPRLQTRALRFAAPAQPSAVSQLSRCWV